MNSTERFYQNKNNIHTNKIDTTDRNEIDELDTSDDTNDINGLIQHSAGTLKGT